MKALITLMIVVIGITKITAQEISNVRAFQENGKAVVMYDLLSIDATKEFYIKIFSSIDGGKTFGTLLTEVTGDVNALVKPGTNKTAIWDILKESTSAKGEFVFRVDAVTVGPNGVLPGMQENGVSIQVIDVTKSNTDVALVISFTNKNATAVQLICSNFLVVDDTDKICRDIGGDVGKIILINPNERKTATILVKGVSANSKSFSQFDFRASSITPHFKRIPFLTN